MGCYGVNGGLGDWAIVALVFPSITTGRLRLAGRSLLDIIGIVYPHYQGHWMKRILLMLLE